MTGGALVDLAASAAMAATGGNPTLAAVSVGVAGYLRRLSLDLSRVREDTNQSLRLLKGEDDVEQDGGLIGRVEDHGDRLENLERGGRRDARGESQ